MLKTKSILIRYLEVEIFQAEGLKLQSSKKSVLRCKIARDSVHVVRIVDPLSPNPSPCLPNSVSQKSSLSSSPSSPPYKYLTRGPRRAHLPSPVCGWALINQTLDQAKDNLIPMIIQWAREYGEIFRTTSGSTMFIWINSQYHASRTVSEYLLSHGFGFLLFIPF